jgi:hypothetical protein
MALRSTLNGCWQLTHKRPPCTCINRVPGNGTVGAGRFPILHNRPKPMACRHVRGELKIFYLAKTIEQGEGATSLPFGVPNRVSATWVKSE